MFGLVNDGLRYAKVSFIKQKENAHSFRRTYVSVRLNPNSSFYQQQKEKTITVWRPAFYMYSS
jgi:hypothetical protein